MEILNYLRELKCTQQTILNYLECQENYDENYEKIIKYLEEMNIQEDRYKLKMLLHLLSKLIKNHNQQHNFFEKIEKLLLIYKDKIKQSYSNYEIFNIFKSNKKIILFLINENIIAIDEQIAQYFKHKSSMCNYKKYIEYFCHELKPFLDDVPKIEIENFEEKRKIGENESYICFLIRNDMIKEFVIYVNKNSINLSATIQPSLFETNNFLLRNDHTLIEYAAFFGSIQIFQYLRLNSVKMDPLLWRFAVHGKNAEIIHLLEEDRITPYNESYNECYREAVKCHHNEIAKYIDNNYNYKNRNRNDKNCCDFYSDPLCLYFRYHNYEFIPTDIDYQLMLFYACNYDYFDLVKFLLDSQKVELNGLYKWKAPKPPDDPTNIRFPIKERTLNFAAKKNNQDILRLLLSKDEIKIVPYCFNFCEKLTEINLPETLTEIGCFSFWHCSSLVEITIPASIKNIGVGSFSFCSNLKRVTILSPINKISESTFNECTSLEMVKIPSTVTRIEKNAFSECKKLKEIKFPESLKFIGSYAFWGCESLSNIILPSNVIKICSGSFWNCGSITEIVIPSGVKVINDYTFYHCKSLAKIEIPLSVKIIGENAFFYCTSLTEIIIPSSVIKVSAEAFNGCLSLKKIEIPSSVTEIESHCFLNCQSLAEIIIPPSVTSIDESAFERCSSLVEISLPSSIKSIGKNAFYECTSLAHIAIPSSVMKIENCAFYECSSLKEISFISPSSVSSFGKEAFEGCSSLKQIVIPSSVISINQDCFYKCSSLEQVTFEKNSSLKSIEKGAFVKCVSLKNISIPDSATYIAADTFVECLSLEQVK